MPRFKVIQYRDAVIRYEVELEAASAKAALAHACSVDCTWIERGVSSYDSADMEVCDLEGNELIPARQVW